MKSGVSRVNAKVSERLMKALSVIFILTLVGCACAHKRAALIFDNLYIRHVTNSVASAEQMTSALEMRWDLRAMHRFCKETETWPRNYATMAPRAGDWEGELYRGKKTEFDRIYWYGNPSRFTVEVFRGKKVWVIDASASLLATGKN